MSSGETDDSNTPVRRTSRARKVNPRFVGADIDEEYRKLVGRITASNYSRERTDSKEKGSPTLIAGSLIEQDHNRVQNVSTSMSESPGENWVRFVSAGSIQKQAEAQNSGNTIQNPGCMDLRVALKTISVKKVKKNKGDRSLSLGAGPMPNMIVRFRSSTESDSSETSVECDIEKKRKLELLQKESEIIKRLRHDDVEHKLAEVFKMTPVSNSEANESVISGSVKREHEAMLQSSVEKKAQVDLQTASPQASSYAGTMLSQSESRVICSPIKLDQNPAKVIVAPRNQIDLPGKRIKILSLKIPAHLQNVNAAMQSSQIMLKNFSSLALKVVSKKDTAKTMTPISSPVVPLKEPKKPIAVAELKTTITSTSGILFTSDGEDDIPLNRLMNKEPEKRSGKDVNKNKKLVLNKKVPVSAAQPKKTSKVTSSAVKILKKKKTIESEAKKSKTKPANQDDLPLKQLLLKSKEAVAKMRRQAASDTPVTKTVPALVPKSIKKIQKDESKAKSLLKAKLKEEKKSKPPDKGEPFKGKNRAVKDLGKSKQEIGKKQKKKPMKFRMKFPVSSKIKKLAKSNKDLTNIVISLDGKDDYACIAIDKSKLRPQSSSKVGISTTAMTDVQAKYTVLKEGTVPGINQSIVIQADLPEPIQNKSLKKELNRSASSLISETKSSEKSSKKKVGDSVLMKDKSLIKSDSKDSLKMKITLNSGESTAKVDSDLRNKKHSSSTSKLSTENEVAEKSKSVIESKKRLLASDTKPSVEKESLENSLTESDKKWRSNLGNSGTPLKENEARTKAEVHHVEKKIRLSVMSDKSLTEIVTAAKTETDTEKGKENMSAVSDVLISGKQTMEIPEQKKKLLADNVDSQSSKTESNQEGLPLVAGNELQYVKKEVTDNGDRSTIVSNDLNISVVKDSKPESGAEPSRGVTTSCKRTSASSDVGSVQIKSEKVKADTPLSTKTQNQIKKEKEVVSVCEIGIKAVEKVFQEEKDKKIKEPEKKRKWDDEERKELKYEKKYDSDMERSKSEETKSGTSSLKEKYRKEKYDDPRNKGSKAVEDDIKRERESEKVHSKSSSERVRKESQKPTEHRSESQESELKVEPVEELNKRETSPRRRKESLDERERRDSSKLAKESKSERSLSRSESSERRESSARRESKLSRSSSQDIKTEDNRLVKRENSVSDTPPKKGETISPNKDVKSEVMKKESLSEKNPNSASKIKHSFELSIMFDEKEYISRKKEEKYHRSKHSYKKNREDQKSPRISDSGLESERVNKSVKVESTSASDSDRESKSMKAEGKNSSSSSEGQRSKYHPDDHKASRYSQDKSRRSDKYKKHEKERSSPIECPELLSDKKCSERIPSGSSTDPELTSVKNKSEVVSDVAIKTDVSHISQSSEAVGSLESLKQESLESLENQNSLRPFKQEDSIPRSSQQQVDHQSVLTGQHDGKVVCKPEVIVDEVYLANTTVTPKEEDETSFYGFADRANTPNEKTAEGKSDANVATAAHQNLLSVLNLKHVSDVLKDAVKNETHEISELTAVDGGMHDVNDIIGNNENKERDDAKEDNSVRNSQPKNEMDIVQTNVSFKEQVFVATGGATKKSVSSDERMAKGVEGVVEMKEKIVDKEGKSSFIKEEEEAEERMVQEVDTMLSEEKNESQRSKILPAKEFTKISKMEEESQIERELLAEGERTMLGKIEKGVDIRKTVSEEDGINMIEGEDKNERSKMLEDEESAKSSLEKGTDTNEQLDVKDGGSSSEKEADKRVKATKYDKEETISNTEGSYRINSESLGKTDSERIDEKRTNATKNKELTEQSSSAPSDCTSDIAKSTSSELSVADAAVSNEESKLSTDRAAEVQEASVASLPLSETLAHVVKWKQNISKLADFNKAVKFKAPDNNTDKNLATKSNIAKTDDAPGSILSYNADVIITDSEYLQQSKLKSYNDEKVSCISKTDETTVVCDRVASSSPSHEAKTNDPSMVSSSENIEKPKKIIVPKKKVNVSMKDYLFRSVFLPSKDIEYADDGASPESASEKEKVSSSEAKKSDAAPTEKKKSFRKESESYGSSIPVSAIPLPGEDFTPSEPFKPKPEITSSEKEKVIDERDMLENLIAVGNNIMETTEELSQSSEDMSLSSNSDDKENQSLIGNRSPSPQRNRISSVEEEVRRSLSPESKRSVSPLPDQDLPKPKELTPEEREEIETKNRKIVEERMKNFEKLEENYYLVEKGKSKSSKEVRRMVCDCTLTKEEIERNEMGCGEDCLNRLLMIECGSRCPLEDRCTNKNFQLKKYTEVEVFNADEKGCGVRAVKDIPAATFIMEYVGEVFDTKEFKRRRKEYGKSSNAHFYFMALRSNRFIDATLKGNISRFINHSCMPNAETQKWTVNGDLRVGFFATKVIPAGEEINFDYRLERYGQEPQKCYCGTSVCRGWLGESPDEKTKEEKEEDRRKEMRNRKRREERRSYFEDVDLEDEIEKLNLRGLRNRQDTLTLSRLMVRAVDSETRMRLLKMLELGEEACRRLFLDYHGLKLLWSWMADISSSQKCNLLKLEILKTLSCLPVTNKTQLIDSKVMNIVERWSKKLASPEKAKEESTEKVTLAESAAATTEKKASDVSEDSDTESPDSKDGSGDPSPTDTVSPDDSSLDSSEASVTAKTNQNNVDSVIQVADSAVVNVEEDNSSSSSPPDTEEVTELCVAEMASKLLPEWNSLKEAFRIPKKQRLQLMKEHEREVDKEYKEYLDRKGEAGEDKTQSYYDRWRYGADKEKSKRRERRKDRRQNRRSKDDDDKGLSKEERRELFAKQVAKEDEEARQKKLQQEMWKLHEARCQILKQNPYFTPMFDPSGQYYWDPASGSWQAYTGPHLSLPVPASYGATVNMVGDSLDFDISKGQMFLTGAFYPLPQTHTSESENTTLSNGAVPKSIELANIPLPGESPVSKSSPSVGESASITLTDESAELEINGIETSLLVPPTAITIILPAKWKLARDEANILYFYHTKTRHTQWEVPTPDLHEKLMAQYCLASDSESDLDSDSDTSSSSNSEDFSSSEEEEEKKEEVEETLVQRSSIFDEKMIRRIRGKKKRSDKLVQERVISPILFEDREAARRERKEAKERAREEARKERWTNYKNRLGNKISEAPCGKDEAADSPIGIDEDDLMETGFNFQRFMHKYKAVDVKPAGKEKSKERAMTAMADNSEQARKIKDNFRSRMATYIVSVLNPYRRSDCNEGRITNNEDFKYLARKLTHFVMVKELKQLPSIGGLDCSESVKHKTKEFVKKYMGKYGSTFKRDPNDTKEY